MSLLEKLNNRENVRFPLFTSCCPGWVRFIRSQYPDMIEQLSTAKSPQQMFGAIAKTYYADYCMLIQKEYFVYPSCHVQQKNMNVMSQF